MLITGIQIAVIAGAVAASLLFGRIARDTLSGVAPQKLQGLRDWVVRSRSRWAVLAGMAVATMFAALSVLTYDAVPLEARPETSSGPRLQLQHAMPYLMRKVSLSPFANLAYAKLSPSKEEGNEIGKTDLVPSTGADLRSRNLRYCDALGAELAGADLSGSDLTSGYLEYANLRNARLILTRLTFANLGWSNLRGALLYGTQLGGAFLYGAQLQAAHFDDSAFADLVQLQVSSRNWVLAYWGRNSTKNLNLPEDHNARVEQKDLSGYDFANLSARFMQGAELQGWVLRNANFSGVELDDANLSRSDLRGSVFSGARVSNVNFQGADLRGAKLREAKGLTQWQVNSAIADNTTQLPPGLFSGALPHH